MSLCYGTVDSRYEGYPGGGSDSRSPLKGTGLFLKKEIWNMRGTWGAFCCCLGKQAAIWLVTVDDVLELSATPANSQQWEVALTSTCKELNSPNLNEIGSVIPYPPAAPPPSPSFSAWPVYWFQWYPLRGSSHAIPRLPIYSTESWWICVVPSHQLCGHLLQGNKKLRYTPGVCRQSLFRPDHISASAEIKMLHLP